jgi:hypothetical protein
MRKDDLQQLASDLETIADWKEDLVRRTRAAELCQASSVGLADERRSALLRGTLPVADHERRDEEASQ